ncbi:MAG: alpha/beta hydrolase [bacterium]
MMDETKTGNHFDMINKIRKDTEIYLQGWRAFRENKAVIGLVHGLGEHSGRYKKFANFLNENGYSLIAVDLFGHGKSEGKRGHISSYKVFMDNINLLLEEVDSKFPELPSFLYGHSMGGNLILNYILRHQPNLTGMIVSAPWLKLASEPPVSQKILGKVMNYIYPGFTQSNGIDSEALSRKEEENEDYKEDPLVHDKISVRLFEELSQAGKFAIENASNINLPVLLMHGTADNITSFAASKKIAASSENITFKKWNGFYHELHNEPEKREVYKYVLEWMEGLIN